MAYHRGRQVHSDLFLTHYIKQLTSPSDKKSLQDVPGVRVDDVGNAARFGLWRLYATVCAVSHFGRAGRLTW